MRHGGWMILFAALILLAILAMGRCGTTAQVYPTWTPRPTATVKVYPSWTPVPSATRRAGATAMPTWTATPKAHITPDGSPPTPTVKPCFSPWTFSVAERYRIQAAAVFADPPERDLIPRNDLLCGIGLYDNDLGMPTTAPFAVEGDIDGSKIVCRGFCMGVVAVMQQDGLDDTCQAWAILRWSGEARE